MRHEPPMTREKQNVALLALCQSLAMTSMTVLFTVAALVGRALVADASLATLPLAVMQVAVMLATIPASMLMQRRGRRFGFAVGTLIGIVGIGLAVAAVLIRSFPLFCAGTVLMGVFSGFSGFYRFAAAEAASESFRAQAISLVVAGGVISAVLGPNLASVAKDAIAQAEFAGSLLSIVGLQVLILLLLIGIRLPIVQRPVIHKDIAAVGRSPSKSEGRSLAQILRQPVFIVAALGSSVGYGVMALLMTATPLAMTGMNHSFHSAASVIQWHVLGMFAPSFFTGFLIARFGILNIILAGVVLNLASVAIALSGVTLPHFLIALTVLGLGWNFMFVGSTTLLTETYTPAEKAKTQAAHDFLMFGAVAGFTFLSGHLLNGFGWAVVNYAALPLLLVTLGAVLWLKLRSKEGAGKRGIVG
ncbi:MFS transporter [Thermoleptolyngbya sp. M55_K2018_002]|uniref:MFS transporter n=1 Tax=Thermoleptolyngbya sp. M55_K2018_002 TaxID=2747808 RepID=UPI0025D8E82D|nr:MFS transporter [Thermoleptolyngbya sp. M55_K2018_002]